MWRHVLIVLGLLVLGATLVTGIWLLRNYDPRQATFFPPCMLHRFTGLHCPGCGTTRALHALVHGNVLDAMSYNPLMIVGIPVMLAAMWWSQRMQQSRGVGIRWLGQGILTIFLLYWLLRNVPSPERGWLAPQAWTESIQAEEAE